MLGQQFVSDFNVFRVKTNEAWLKKWLVNCCPNQGKSSSSIWRMANFHELAAPKNQFLSMVMESGRGCLLRQSASWPVRVGRRWAESGIISRVIGLTG